MDSQGPLKNSTLADRVYDVLFAEISSGALVAGQRLVETEIARRLQVSQAPVREALRRLVHTGLVLHLERRGSFVATVDEDAARRAYRVRAALEDVAAREFCRSAPDEAISQLAEVLDRMREAAASDDLLAFIDQDMRFHRIVWEAGESELLARFWPLIEATIRAFTSISNRVYFGGLEEVAETHAPLLRSLRDRNGDLAGALLTDHAHAVWERVDRVN